MPRLQEKSFKSPEQIRHFQMPGLKLYHTTRPRLVGSLWNQGWHWSPDVVPIANTRSRQIHHLGVVPKGRFPNETDADEVCELGIDGVDEHSPRHDGFVVSAEPFEAIEFASAQLYAPLAGAMRPGN